MKDDDRRHLTGLEVEKFIYLRQSRRFVSEPPTAVEVLLKQVELSEPNVLLFLVADILPHYLFVGAYRSDEIPARPEVLTCEVAFFASVCSGNMNRTLPFQIAHNGRNCILGRNTH